MARYQPALRRVLIGMPEAHERSAASCDTTVQVRPGDGRGAATPACIPARGWRQVLRRCVWRMFEDRLLGEAAAVAFYALLAVFPGLAALVTLCGLFVDPEAAAQKLQALAGMLPAGSAEVARDALGRMAAVGGGQVGLAVALAAGALWSAVAATSNSHWPYRCTGIIVRVGPRHEAAALSRSASA